MDLLVNINWISLFVLAISLLIFKLLNKLAYKINWTLVVLLSMVFGAIVGGIFSTDDGAYLVWLNLIGDVYVNVITAVVAPVIMISIISGFISLNSKEKMKSIGVKSVFWLMFSSATAIILTFIFGAVTGIGKNGAAVFAEIASVADNTVAAYQEMATSFDQVLLSFFPVNVIGDLANDHVVAIIIIAIAIAVAYVSVASEEGESKVASFRSLVDVLKKIIYKILSYVIDLTPYAVFCLIAGATNQILSDKAALVQLVLLVVMIYVVCLVHMYLVNAVILRVHGKLNPFTFFKKIFQAQATAFTTQSSVGSLPVSIDRLTKHLGVDEEVANFTASLGTTIGMPGCTCVWPILLAFFYIHAMGISWSAGDYLALAAVSLILSLGSAGVPGIGIVSAMAVFSSVNLPIQAIVLLIPINNISDMIRTAMNVTTANVSAVLVAKDTGHFDEEMYNASEKKEALCDENA